MTVSVLIPCRNAGEHIVAAVRSAKAQPETGEVIVADAGSTDQSIELARELGATILELGDVGQAAARNALAQRTRHRWVQWLDADDYLRPGKFAAQIAVMIQTSAAYSYCDLEIVTADVRTPRLLAAHAPLAWARLGAPVQIGCYLTDAELARAVPFDPDFDSGGNNAKWALDLAASSAPFVHVPVIGCVWRNGWSADQTTADVVATSAGVERFRQAVRARGMESPASPIAAPKLEMS